MNKEFTVKHKLNKFLKPVIDPQNIEIKMYPVYCQVIFDRQNYLFPSSIKNYYTKIDLSSEKDKALMRMEVDFITSLIRYELNEKGQRFNLRGLGKKYTNYRVKVHTYWNDLLRTELKMIVRNYKSKYFESLHFDNVNLDAGILYEAIGQLIPELIETEKFQSVGQGIKILVQYKILFPERGNDPFIYPAFYHWLSEGHFKRLEKELVKKDNISVEVIRDHISKMNQNIRLATVDAHI